MPTRDEIKIELQKLIEARSATFFGAENPDNQVAEAVIALLMLYEPVWRTAIEDLKVEQAAGISRDRVGRLLRRDVGGTDLVVLDVATEALYLSALVLLRMWREKNAPGAAAPVDVVSGRDLDGFAESLSTMLQRMDTNQPTADALDEYAHTPSPSGATPLLLAYDAWAYRVLNTALVIQAPGGDFRLWNPLDNRTSRLCRSLAGSLIHRRDLNLSNLAPKWGDPRDSRGAVRWLPPYHARCRTYVVPAAYYAEG